jgi:hypothetical protein
MENAGGLKAALTSYSSQNSLTIWALKIRFAKILSAQQYLRRFVQRMSHASGGEGIRLQASGKPRT